MVRRRFRLCADHAHSGQIRHRRRRSGRDAAVDAATIEALLDSDPHAPLVMIDGEDAQALNEETPKSAEKRGQGLSRSRLGPTLRFIAPADSICRTVQAIW